MNTLTVQHTSRQVAANDDYKSVNRQLHQVARWVESIPDLTGGVPYWDRLLPALQHRKAEIDALMATDGYKQAIAMLTPLAAPPTFATSASRSWISSTLNRSVIPW